VRAGLRRGELVALRWGDVQFGADEDDPNRYIYVQRNYVQGAFTTPKSKKPRRVDLSRELRKTLLELRDKRLLSAFQEGMASIADHLVFPSQTGDIVLDPDNLVHYYFLPALEKAGLRKIRFHDSAAHLRLATDSGRRLSDLCERADGAQQHPGHRRCVRPSNPGRKYRLGGRPGPENKSATKRNPGATGARPCERGTAVSY
jgi:integrase